MKIYLPLNKHAKTGKGLFMLRLSDALKNLGVDITSNPKKPHDISLHLIKIKKKTNAKLKVVRFNGVYHNTAISYKELNYDIKKHSKEADAVIYQSEFSKNMVRRYIHKFDIPSKVILNGADPEYFSSIKPAESDFEYNFLAFSRWRPHKRLKRTIKSFLHAEIPNSCLWIAGDLKQSGLSRKHIRRYFSTSKVRYLGILRFASLARYLIMSNAVVHLCWFDCCPNSVVEAICAKKIVITNNVGGTKEIVKHAGGIICKIDKPYDFEPVDLYNPPKFDTNIIVAAFHRAIQGDIVVSNKHIDIHNIALQYKDFFEKILGR